MGPPDPFGLTHGAFAGSQQKPHSTDGDAEAGGGLQTGLRPVGGCDGDAEASGGCPAWACAVTRAQDQTWSSQDPEHPFLCISVSSCRRSLETEVDLSKITMNTIVSLFRGNLVSEFRAQPLLFTQLYLVSSVSPLWTVLPLCAAQVTGLGEPAMDFEGSGSGGALGVKVEGSCSGHLHSRPQLPPTPGG